MELEYYVPEDFAADDTFVNYCQRNNEADIDFWTNWLDAHPERVPIAEKAMGIVFMMSIKLHPDHKQREWEKINIAGNKIQEINAFNTGIRRKRRFMKAATLVVIFIIAGAGITFRLSRQKIIEHNGASASSLSQYKASSGQKKQIILNDGTQVWLNADSKLICNKGFGHAAIRKVTLIGEAYFNVATDALHPFIIHTKRLDIRVLGTSFNVKAYPDDNTVEASLIKGSIEVSLNRDPARKIILKPNEKIVVFNHNIELRHITASLNKIAVSAKKDDTFKIAPLQTSPLLDSGTVETAWMKGKLVFKDEAFSRLALQMERKYNVHFHFTDSTLKAYHFTGIFSTENVGQALHALQLTSPSDPFKYDVEGKDVFIARLKP